MTSVKRRQTIIKILEQNSPMSVEQLADEFKVTPTTIRRDLIVLEENKFITRSRGYVSIAYFSNVLDLTIRNNINGEEKQCIANAAMSLISPNESIIFDSGSTTLALANRIRNENIKDIVVITNSIPIAMVLADSYQTIMTGGIVHRSTMSLIGPEADEYFHSITLDKLFLGAPGVRGAIGLTASCPFQHSIKKQMIKSARQVIALIDSTKFETNSINMFCTFEEVDVIVTTKTQKNEQVIEEIESKGVKIIYANNNDKI